MIHPHLSLFASCGTTIFPHTKQVLQLGNSQAKHPNSESGFRSLEMRLMIITGRQTITYLEMFGLAVDFLYHPY